MPLFTTLSLNGIYQKKIHFIDISDDDEDEATSGMPLDDKMKNTATTIIDG